MKKSQEQQQLETVVQPQY